MYVEQYTLTFMVNNRGFHFRKIEVFNVSLDLHKRSQTSSLRLEFDPSWVHVADKASNKSTDYDDLISTPKDLFG